MEIATTIEAMFAPASATSVTASSSPGIAMMPSMMRITPR